MTTALDRITNLETCQEYIEALTFPQFIVLYLRVCYGLSFSQIAAELDISKEAVRQRLDNAAHGLVHEYPHLKSRQQESTRRTYHRPKEAADA